jgi:hypothetical protein
METPRPTVKFGWTRSGGRSGRALDIRLRETIALVEKRSANELGLSIDETVAKIEVRGMSSTLAVASEGLQRDVGGFGLDRLYGDACGFQKVSDVRFGFRYGSLPLPRHAEHRFVNGDRGRFGPAGSLQRRQKHVRVRLSGKHRDDCGRVNDDHKSPLRSS